jgi:hypothetical protein
MKKFFLPFLALVLIIACAGCLDSTGSPGIAGTSAAVFTTSAGSAEPVTVVYDTDDVDSAPDNAAGSTITLQGDTITFSGSGITVDGTKVTVTQAGTYTISGTLNNGQILVDAGDEEKVKLIFDRVDISCSTTAPIQIINADKTVITLAEGSDNSVTDGSSYVFENAETDEPDAAIFSSDDLTINGGGSLTVTANYNHGIVSKDDLKITGGHITVTSTGDGIRGKDTIAVKDGTITIHAGGDGMQSSNDEDPEKGYVAIEGGTITITAKEDGIQAETTLNISGGTMTLTTGSGSGTISSVVSDPWGSRDGAVVATGTMDTSIKGLKASAITITGGVITLDTADDAIHAGNSIVISGGTITAASGDDGIHADSTLAINGGNIQITKSYEGIESAAITIRDGTIRIIASDDGINAAGGNDASSLQGRPGQNTFNPTSGISLTIGGGYIFVNANGDGIDVNGPITMNGGTVIVNGPTNNGNGALDYDGTFTISGGYLLAAGSSGMAQAPGTSSTQNSVMVNFASAQPAGTMVHIETEDGKEILTFVPAKAYQSVVLSSSLLEKGTTYTVYTEGSSTGTNKDGLYSGGTYTAGTQVYSFTISSTVTTAGSATGMGMQGGGAPGGAPGQRPAGMVR